MKTPDVFIAYGSRAVSDKICSVMINNIKEK
ncbi:hypothetical protein RF007C_05410 [Ruminococcus flavefaciens 007c]|uniref:Uncharacterized protein n=1 Tax=Ruminococcus flavefaciens 007c TaxID=1341157 RepID=W7UIQ9_RUMFL|nr:hypothetical protein RF007C_05410 [Ruminococcus flavefaciens 007c]